MGLVTTLAGVIAGRPVALPGAIAARWPELDRLNYRRGGLPLKVGGWMLGQTTVAAITLGRTVFLAAGTRLEPELLLHEFRHVEQFAERKTFPLRYIWESLRHGYHANRYEAEARSYAARCLAREVVPGFEEDA